MGVRVVNTPIQGLLVIEPDVFRDARGWFVESYNKRDFDQIGIDGCAVDRVAQMATEDPSATGNPIPFTAGQYGEILRQAISGDL